MKVAVLQQKDINSLSNNVPHLPPKNPATQKKQQGLGKNTQPEEKKKHRENTYSVNVITTTSQSRNGQYPHEIYSNQNLATIPSSTKQKGTLKKKRSASKSSKQRDQSPNPSHSFNAISYPDLINSISQQNSQNLNNNSLVLKRTQINSTKSHFSGSTSNELYLQLNMSSNANGNIGSSPLIKTTSNQAQNNQKGDNSPYDGGVKNFGLKANKTASNFKITKNLNIAPRKKSLVSLEQSQQINSNGQQEQNSSQTNRKPLSSIRIRSGKLLNNSVNGGISPLQTNLGLNSSNKKLNNQLSELNSIRNSQQRNSERIIDRNVNMFRVDEVGQENIHSIQYTQFNNNNNDDSDENYDIYNNQNIPAAVINNLQNSLNTQYSNNNNHISPLNLNNQLHQTQRQSLNSENTLASKWVDDTIQARNKITRTNSSKRRSNISSSLSNNNKKGMLNVLRNGEAVRGEDIVQGENSINKPQENILRLQLMTKKHNWRDLVRSYLQQTQYTEIHLSFYDIVVEIYDGLIFNTQMKSLKYLNLNFRENKYFNDSSLLFLSAIKIPSLEKVRINTASTQCSRIGANFLLFDFNYVPQVEIIVGDLTHEKTLRFTQQEKFINIDFSAQQNISRSEILSLSDSIFKANHKHLSLTLDGVLDLNHEKLKILGRCIQEVDELQISFQNCNMNLQDLTQFIDGLTYINTRSNISNSSQKQPQLQSKPAQIDPEKIIYDEFDEDILASKPISFFIKKGINEDMTSPRQSQGAQAVNVSQSLKFENSIIQKLTVDFRQNKEEIDQKFMKIFKRFKAANTLKLFIDIDKQVKLQYDKQVQAFCLGECLKESFNCIQIAVSDQQTIYFHDKLNKSIKINASNCGISPYQLVDIQRSLNFLEDIVDMELDLSGNWQISFAHLKKMFDKLPYFDRLKRIRLNIKSVFIYEVEFITLYFLIKRIPDMNIVHDFERSRLIELANESIKLNFKGPFSRSKINNILDMQNFCEALDTCTLPNIKDIQMTFFFNYGLRGDSLLRLCQSIGRFPRIEKLDLNFNSCFLTFNDIVFFCNGLNNIDVTLKQLKLTFTNNDNITSNSLIKLAKTLQRFPILDQLDIICETHELHLNPTDTSYQHIFNKFNTKTAVSRRNPRQKLQVQRVVPKIYQVLAHDIETMYLPVMDQKRQMKQQQNQYFTQLDMPFSVDDMISPLEDNINAQQGIHSDNSMTDKPPIIPALMQIEEIEPPKRNKVVQSTEQNWISLQFMEGVLYTEYELMNLGYSLAQQETINHIITVPQKPIVEKIFNEMKRARLAGILFTLLVTPEMVFNPTQIFCDLYL